MATRCLVVVLLALAALVGATAAPAKDFAPGDLRICGGQRCVPITNRPILKLLSAFYYGRKPPALARAPRLGARAFELRFRNGYVTGIVASPRLDRFLSYGVHLGWFGQGDWYRVPTAAAKELRKRAASLRALHVTRESLAKSR